MSSVVDAVLVWILLWSYSQLARGGCILDVARHARVHSIATTTASTSSVISCLNLVHVRIAIRSARGRRALDFRSRYFEICT